jgi:polysaccharide biosynthesis protein PelF
MTTDSPVVVPLTRRREEPSPQAGGSVGSLPRSKPRRPRARSSLPRVLMITEGTYPYAVGGVSSWCDVLIAGLEQVQWDILPIVAGSKRMHMNYELPSNARLRRPIELWSEDGAPRRMPRLHRETGPSIPTQLVRGLMPWKGSRPRSCAAGGAPR